MDSTEAWVKLIHLPGIGAVQQNRLLERFGSPEAIFSEASQSDLNEKLKAAVQNPQQQRIDETLRWLEIDGNAIVTQQSPHYPKQLKLLSDAPALLFTLGDLQLLNTPQIAIVGSRNPSRIGAETASDFAHYFASVGLTVTSGLALGVDTASHEGALKAGGSTIAVLGTGPDRVYPASNRNLAHQIVAQG
ncbi:MAG: DNA-processing protein DprA, partial [Gammaproteobacteria bacterium]|nr:DNA-processing protein DprA [Gammaproteobacteria bacterium]